MQSPAAARRASNNVTTSGAALALFAGLSVAVQLMRSVWVMESVAALG